MYVLPSFQQNSRKTSAQNLLQIPNKESVASSMASPNSDSHHLDLKSMSPRQRVFNELVQTETNFVNVLRTILHVFKKPLDDPNPIGGQLLNQTELKIIFGNLPPIFDVHNKMLTVSFLLKTLHYETPCKNTNYVKKSN